MRVLSNVYGAVSLVNAIATGKGATLGIDLTTQVEIEKTMGSGITVLSGDRNISSKLINHTVQKIVSKKNLEKHKIQINIKSDVPTGYGLKSSSAISSCVALACAKLFKDKIDDRQVLYAGVDASIETKVSITGAYDDACACYYGGFVLTDNYKRKIIHAKKISKDLAVVIFIPRSRKRGNPKKLYKLKPIFEKALELAPHDHWNAMILNGIATGFILNSDPELVTKLVEKGALGASVSGNGPAVSAVTQKNNMSRIKKVFSNLEGRIITANINNKKAEVHEL